MLTAKIIKEKAKELGAVVCGIGDIEEFKAESLQRDPKAILPSARCIIGFGIKIPRALYTAMDNKAQFYNYTNLGVKYIDETFAEIFLLGNKYVAHYSLISKIEIKMKKKGRKKRKNTLSKDIVGV